MIVHGKVSIIERESVYIFFYALFQMVGDIHSFIHSSREISLAVHLFLICFVVVNLIHDLQRHSV